MWTLSLTTLYECLSDASDGSMCVLFEVLENNKAVYDGPAAEQLEFIAGAGVKKKPAAFPNFPAPKRGKHRSFARPEKLSTKKFSAQKSTQPSRRQQLEK